jgi:hypothetical protein
VISRRASTRVSVTIWLVGAVLLAAPALATTAPCDEQLHDCCCGPEDCGCHSLPSTGLSESPCSDWDTPALPTASDRLRAPGSSDSISPLATDKAVEPTLPANRYLAEHRSRSGPRVAQYILCGALLI